MGRIRLQRIADASAARLEAAIQQAVEPGSMIRTDGWKGYNKVANRGYHSIHPRAEPHHTTCSGWSSEVNTPLE